MLLFKSMTASWVWVVIFGSRLTLYKKHLAFRGITTIKRGAFIWKWD